MTVRIILKSGVEFSVKCEAFSIRKDVFGSLESYNIKGITENKPVYLDFEQVAAVVRVMSDETEAETSEGIPTKEPPKGE